MADNVQLFSIRSDDYAQFRPTYPDALFDWLTEHCFQTRRALDVAAGSGQATLALLSRFDQVIACDASADQLTSQRSWGAAWRFAAQAEQLPLGDGLVDLIVVAQALHWFATPAFFGEAKRVIAPGGLFCAWCYSLLRIDPAIDAVIARLHGETLSDFWPRGRTSVDAGYRDIQAPFETLIPPDFAIETHWALPQLLGYLRTWSAAKQWQHIHGSDPIAQLEHELTKLWGAPGRQRLIRWPLHVLAGYPTR